MKILGIIPSRYASSRFPGKPLVDIGGKSMVRRVFEQASLSKTLTDVVVATDDERIFNHVLGFGGRALMTSADHLTGTERCAEVIEKYGENWDLAINIQGDEPFISPSQIDLLASCFEDESTEVATLAKRISDPAELESPHVVKVVFGISGMAIYFSRFPIPFLRNQTLDANKVGAHAFYKHIGLYAYRAESLKKLAGLMPSGLELAESLEQLRWLENGIGIKVGVTDFDSIGIDTPEDLRKFGEKFNS
jgi:3-deoxy-manno-octulosonate cytidylyltransferase (CMP-KDO synthetase)